MKQIGQVQDSRFLLYRWPKRTGLSLQPALPCLGQAPSFISVLHIHVQRGEVVPHPSADTLKAIGKSGVTGICILRALIFADEPLQNSLPVGLVFGSILGRCTLGRIGHLVAVNIKGVVDHRFRGEIGENHILLIHEKYLVLHLEPAFPQKSGAVGSSMDAWQCLDGPGEVGEYFTVLNPLLPGRGWSPL